MPYLFSLPLLSFVSSLFSLLSLSLPFFPLPSSGPMRENYNRLINAILALPNNDRETRLPPPPLLSTKRAWRRRETFQNGTELTARGGGSSSSGGARHGLRARGSDGKIHDVGGSGGGGNDGDGGAGGGGGGGAEQGIEIALHDGRRMSDDGGSISIEGGIAGGPRVHGSIALGGGLRGMTSIARTKFDAASLRKAWEVKDKTTTEDWLEWMRRFSLQMLGECASFILFLGGRR